MTLGRSTTTVTLGLIAGILAFAGLAVLRTPSLADPGDTASLEFGVGLTGLGLLCAVTAWGVSGGRPWGRVLALIVATACAASGIFGLYGLVMLVGQGNLWSRMNIAVLAVLLLMGITSAVLLIALWRAHESAKDAIRVTPPGRAAPLAFGLLIGLGSSIAFSSWLSTLSEPPCCPL